MHEKITISWCSFKTGDTKRSSENKLKDKRRDGEIDRGRAENYRRKSKSPGMTFLAQSGARLLWERRIFCGSHCVGPFETVTTDGHASQLSLIFSHTVLYRDYSSPQEQYHSHASITISCNKYPWINSVDKLTTLRSSACRSQYLRSRC